MSKDLTTPALPEQPCAAVPGRVRRCAIYVSAQGDFLRVLERLRAVLNSATSASTSMLFAASRRSKVLLAFFNDAMSASTCPWVGMKNPKFGS